jgi:hypothetical protein
VNGCGRQEHGVSPELALYVAENQECLLAGFRGSRLDIVSFVALFIAPDLTEYVLAAVGFVHHGVVKTELVHIGDGVFLSHADHFPVLLVLDFLVALRFLATLAEDIDQFGEEFIGDTFTKSEALEALVGQNSDGLFRNGLVKVHF